MRQRPDTSKPTEGGATTKPRRRGLLWAVAGLVVMLLVGGGGAGFYLWSTSAGAQEVAGGQAEPAGPEASSVLTFEPFVVNLADTEGSRFLRVNLRLLVEAAGHGADLQEDEVAMLRARSAILELLSAQVSGHLVTPEGKAELKKNIADRAAAVLGNVKVLDVLFSEFVVQF